MTGTGQKERLSLFFHVIRKIQENTGIYPIERSLKNAIIYTYEYQIHETNE